MRARLVVAIVVVLASPLRLAAQAPPEPPPMTDCATTSLSGLKLICNQQAPEDLVVVPGDQWVVASAYAGSGINLIRVSDRQSHRAYPAAAARKRPDEKKYGDCPGPPDSGPNPRFTTHGLWLQPGTGTVHTLFVVAQSVMGGGAGGACAASLSGEASTTTMATTNRARMQAPWVRGSNRGRRRAASILVHVRRAPEVAVRLAGPVRSSVGRSF